MERSDVVDYRFACHNNNQKSIRADYIYPISYKIAKKGKPDEMDLPY
jgi:hypothetical protein